MIHRLLAHLRRHYAGLIALMLVLGGTAYAASAVGTRDVRDNSLRGIDVHANSLTGRDLANGSVKARDIASSAIPSITFSASVIEDEDSGPHLVNAYGISAVKRTAVGEYEFTIPEGGPPCNVVANPNTPMGNDGKTATVVLTEAAGNKITLTTFDASGAPADLGQALGYAALSVIANCPV